MFVSFVVATYNCADRIPILNETVRALASADCEFCISDGGSTDSTVDLIATSSKVRVLRSAPDNGIYDAWNQVLDDCRGTYVSFIGVDDRPSPEFITEAQRLVSSMDSVPAVVYGNRILERGKHRRRINYSGRPRLFTAHRPRFDIPHQGALNHRSLFESKRFDPQFKLAGDLEFYVALRDAIRERGYLHIPVSQVIAAEEGVSRSAGSFGIYLREFEQIERIHGLRLGYSRTKLHMLKQLEHLPGVFRALKGLAWMLRHDRS